MDNLTMNAPEMEQKETTATIPFPNVEGDLPIDVPEETPEKEPQPSEEELSVPIEEVTAKSEKDGFSKLEEAWKKAPDAQRKVLAHLKSRMEADPGLCSDWEQEHKTFEKLWNFVKENARKKAFNGCACIEDEIVYEWAEDYIRKDDKAEEEAKAKAEEERKKAAAERAAKAKRTRKEKKGESKGQTDLMGMLNTETAKAPKKAEPEKPKGSVEGQASIFDLLGGE